MPPAKRPAYERAGFATDNAYRKAMKQAKEWSAKSSKIEYTKFPAKGTPEEKGEYFRLFASTARPRTKAYRSKYIRYAMKYRGMTREEARALYPNIKI